MYDAPRPFAPQANPIRFFRSGSSQPVQAPPSPSARLNENLAATTIFPGVRARTYVHPPGALVTQPSPDVTVSYRV